MIRHTLSEPPLISGCWTILHHTMKAVKSPLDWPEGSLASLCEFARLLQIILAVRYRIMLH